MLLDVFEILGALAILTAFTAAQLGKVSTTSRVYLVCNLAGSATLAGIAAHDQSWGFLLLEGVWAVVSFAGLAAVLRRRGPTSVT
ncbi:MAG: CBU_0592 family membrane protein, partial [Micromonosporaceae bacterium]